MKRILVLALVLLFPFFVIAKEYESKDINLNLNVKDDLIVLTRDNLDNNPNLEKLKLTKENMQEIMSTNDIYFDILKEDMSYEIIVVVPDTTVEIDNLSKVSDQELEDLKLKLAEEAGVDTANIYKNDYSFIVVEYQDEADYHVINYYTIVNSSGYNIQIQKKSHLSEEDKKDLKEIVDGIKFKIGENSNKSKDRFKKPFDYRILIYGVILGSIAGVITYCIGLKIKSRKSSK